ncbi:acyl carrier protein [Pseudomonas frederiksbergensis]
MSMFFDELMESVQQMNEVLRGERQRSRKHHVHSTDQHPTRREIRLNPTHRNAPDGRRTMNLAPNFPDDHAMHLLMQLLHEELGLPERKTISLATSINFDLGCDGADAQNLMEALEEQFGIDFIDYDAYRYFQPEGFDVHLKRRAKGRGDKVPLTIGMLYQAVKSQRWDTQEIEGQ